MQIYIIIYVRASAQTNYYINRQSITPARQIVTSYPPLLILYHSKIQNHVTICLPTYSLKITPHFP